MAQSMSEVDLALQDENQQCGNLKETAAQLHCALAWRLRQTPGPPKINSGQEIQTEATKKTCSLEGKLRERPTQHLVQGGGADLGTPLSPAYPMTRLVEPVGLRQPQSCSQSLEHARHDLQKKRFLHL